MQPGPELPHHVNSAIVLGRFGFRMVAFGALAILGQRNYGHVLAGLLGAGAVFCATIAVMRREHLLAGELTHWDEAAAYAAIGHLAQNLA
jgi:hypothetical protein